MWLDTAGARFLAQQCGDEPSAVFIHGFGSDLHTWDYQVRAIGDQIPNFRYDLRGFGGTEALPGQPYSHTQDLRSILDSLELRSVDLIGVSMGGSIAVNFALDYPDRVRKLVLISPALVGWEWSEDWQALWREIKERACACDLTGARELWWQHPLFATTRSSQAGPELFKSIQCFHGRQWTCDDHRPMLPDIERIHALALPSLLLTGQQDLADFRLIADLLAGAAPYLRRIDYPSRGHMLHLEAPESCAGEILAFLRD